MKDELQVVVIRPACSHLQGGAERYCMMLVKGLLSAGVKVIFIGARIDRHIQQEITFIDTGKRKGPSSLKNYLFHITVQQALTRFPKAVSYSLSRTYPVDIYRLTDPLHSYHLHLNYRSPLKTLLRRLSIRHRLLLKLERNVLQGPKKAQRIVAISERESKLIKQFYNVNPKRIKVIYNGVDLTIFNPGRHEQGLSTRKQLKVQPEETLYLFAGMDFRRKGLEIVIRAAGLLKHPFKLIVAGSGDINRYKRLANRTGLAKNIRFLGRVQNMTDLYRAADLMVVPTQYDPFGNVHLESLACGLPIVTTIEAGGAEVVTHAKTGFIMKNPSDPMELATYMNEYEGQKAQWPEWRERAYNKAAEFTIEKNITQNLALIEDIARQKQRVG